MKKIAIRQVFNGYIVTIDGIEHVADSLQQASQLAGEVLIQHASTAYAPGKSLADLRAVRDFQQSGQKIEAIKRLRECFSPALNLLVSKDLIETFY